MLRGTADFDSKRSPLNFHLILCQSLFDSPNVGCSGTFSAMVKATYICMVHINFLE